MKKGKITLKEIFEDHFQSFWYESHETKEKVVVTLTAEAFIGKLLMHVPPKYFKMVRTYGVYAGSICTKIRKCYGLLQYIKSGLKVMQYTLKEYWKKETEKLTYRQLMIRTFSKDPYECKRCGEIIELWEIWQNKYGYIYEFGG